MLAGAIEIYGYEWSFGYCPHGSGVYRVLPKSNQMYTYRESMPLGSTDLTKTELKTKIQELQREWAGSSYDLVARNCNHFCAELCERLGCEPLPGMQSVCPHRLFQWPQLNACVCCCMLTGNPADRHFVLKLHYGSAARGFLCSMKPICTEQVWLLRSCTFTRNYITVCFYNGSSNPSPPNLNDRFACSQVGSTGLQMVPKSQ